MKKIISYILLSALMITFLPYSALAETTDVGVKVTGSASIEVVTTISADIILDLTTGETKPTYMEIQNNSLVPVNAKITNISTTSEGAPSTFVQSIGDNLSKEDTKKYVKFTIHSDGQDVVDKYDSILANTEIDLGDMAAKPSYLCKNSDKLVCNDGNIKYYELNANLGKNWDEGDKNFVYQIETVYSIVDSYSDPTLNYNYPEISNSLSSKNDIIDSIDLISITNDLSEYKNLGGYDESQYPSGNYYYVVAVNFYTYSNLKTSDIELSIGDTYHLDEVISKPIIDNDNGRLIFVKKVTDIEKDFVTLNISLLHADSNSTDYSSQSEYYYTKIVKISK